MQAQADNATPLQRKLDLAVALDEIEADTAQRLKRMARTMKMQGFRPGKVPLRIIEQQYGPQARQEALGEAVQRAFVNAVNEQKLRVAGAPRIEPRTGGEGGGRFEFSAVFEVYPEVELGDLSAQEIERPVVEIGDAEVDKTLGILRQQRVRYEPVERAAAEGDEVVMDFLGTLDGTPFAGGEGKNARLVLGQGRWLKDFENGIVGMRAGETREVAVVFPADYHAKELAGKTASFAITLHKVSAPVLPEVDADFAKALGVEDGDLATLRKEIKENLEREARRRVRAHIREQAMEKLLQAADFPLPGALLEGEIGRLAARALDDLAARGVKVPEGASLGPELFQEQAQRRVKLGLIFASLVEKHALHARPEQVRAMVDEQAQSFEKPEEVVQWAYSSSERLDEIEALVVEDNVVEWVLERARVSDKPTAFDELMGNA